MDAQGQSALLPCCRREKVVPGFEGRVGEAEVSCLMLI